LVISEELGCEYQRLFGDNEFEIITDGIADSEISTPGRINSTNQVTIYFSGLLHFAYYPLFNVLADALDRLSKQGFSFKLIIRGAGMVDVLTGRSFMVDYRTDFISDAAVKEEMDTASILYLPIKFTTPEFYLYSLSTKMIGYLGAPGSILFHGPVNSAAGALLQHANAAECCTSLNVDDMVKSIINLIDNNGCVSNNAKILAQKKFNLAEIQLKFWQNA